LTESERDFGRYADVLEQMATRADVAAEHLEDPVTWPRVETAALQLRMLLELIPLAALASHVPEVEAIASAFKKKGAMDAAKLVQRVNPKYWPTPVEQGGDRFNWTVITEGFVTEPEWVSEWGFLSSVLHARNPFVTTLADSQELRDAHARVLDLSRRIATVLRTHWVELPGAGSILAVARNREGHAQVIQLEHPPATS
jgi:hypothetical protein